MNYLPNIEKSAFKRFEYVGYGGGAVFRIRKNGLGNWEAIPTGAWPEGLNAFLVSGTLTKLSTMLAALDCKAVQS
jgi:hypothetical protein